MALPEDFNEHLLIADFIHLDEKKKGDYETSKNFMKQVAKTAVSQGVKHGLNAISKGLGPVGMAMAPALSAAKLASSAQSTMNLHDLLPDSRPSRDLEYPCTCPGDKCVKAVTFSIYRREKSAIKTGISASVVGAPFVALYSLGRNIYKWSKKKKGKERMEYAMGLIDSAKPRYIRPEGPEIVTDFPELIAPGCPKAQAAIAILFRELDTRKPAQNSLAYPRTTAAILSINGWIKVKGAMV